MLTPEEEKRRAIKISKLYEKKRKFSFSEPHEPLIFPAYKLWGSTFVILLPVVITSVFIILFLESKYTSLTDIQGTGIAFITASIVASLLSVIAIRFFRQKVSSLIDNEKGLFLLIVIFLIPLLLLINLFFDFSTANNFLFALYLGLYALLAIFSSSGYIVLLAYILEKNENEKRYLITGLLAILPGLIYSILSKF